jgi:hypothetical protein
MLYAASAINQVLPMLALNAGPPVPLCGWPLNVLWQVTLNLATRAT